MADEQPDRSDAAEPAPPGEEQDPARADESTPLGEGAEPRQSVVAEPQEPRLLRRSRSDRVIAGVCGGLGEYLGVDAVLIRIAALILVLAGGAGFILYLIGWIAIPEAPEAPMGTAARAPTPTGERTTGAVVLGLVFVVLGAFFLADEIWADFLSWKYVWPVALIAIGVAVILRTRR